MSRGLGESGTSIWQVVYLDVDVVVKGDLAELYSVQMSPALGALRLQEQNVVLSKQLLPARP